MSSEAVPTRFPFRLSNIPPTMLRKRIGRSRSGSSNRSPHQSCPASIRALAVHEIKHDGFRLLVRREGSRSPQPPVSTGRLTGEPSQDLAAVRAMSSAPVDRGWPTRVGADNVRTVKIFRAKSLAGVWPPVPPHLVTKLRSRLAVHCGASNEELVICLRRSEAMSDERDSLVGGDCDHDDLLQLRSYDRSARKSILRVSRQ